MKKWILALLALICLVLMVLFWPGKEKDAFSTDEITAASDISRAETEVLAANIQLTTAAGEDVTLQQLYNRKPVCLFFWAPWQADSQQVLANLAEAYAAYGQQIYFVPVVFPNELGEGAALYEKKGYSLPLYQASASAADAENVSSMPHIFFIARGGRIIQQEKKAVTKKQLAYALAKLL